MSGKRKGVGGPIGSPRGIREGVWKKAERLEEGYTSF